MDATNPYESCKIAQNLLDRSPQLLLVPDACGTIQMCDALRRGNVLLASELLRVDPDKQLEHCDKLGLKAVHVVAESGQIAARAGCMEVVSVLLQHSPELIHTKTSNGRTCLHCLTSCRMDATNPYESCKIAQNLLDRSPQLLLVPDACGTIQMCDALRRGNVLLASELLRVDPDKQLEHCDKLGLKAVHVVAESGQPSELRCLDDGEFSENPFVKLLLFSGATLIA
ncbi:hypothetical protein AHF37_07420 [Paragonimus kellicotti]|nr:hypothetical protein AHF37_07420 [Paragonimus kellicotti]